MKSVLITGCVVQLTLLTAIGCNSTNQKQPAIASKEPKESIQYTGRQAFERMTGLAMKWAPDAQPLRLESDLTPETMGQGGMSTLWRGFFASPSRRSVKRFTCSGSRLPNAPSVGVTVDAGENPYTPDVSSLAFAPFLFKVDSDKAYGVAQEHGGQALINKDNKQVVTYLLLHDRKRNVPVWYVIYGAPGKDRKGIAMINATTGDFISAGK